MKLRRAVAEGYFDCWGKRASAWSREHVIPCRKAWARTELADAEEVRPFTDIAAIQFVNTFYDWKIKLADEHT